MPTAQRRPLIDLIPKPTPAAIAVAVLAGAVFASVGMTVQEQSPQVERREAREPARLQRERKRTHELLNKIHRALAEPAERSAAPMRTAITVSRPPRVAVSAPVTVPLSGVWSAEREKWRDGWRSWADRRLKE